MPQLTVVWYGLAANTTTPDPEAGTDITEPTNGSWARVEKTLTDFWGGAYINDDGHAEAENVQALEFTNYDGGGATITHIVEWDDPIETAASHVRRTWELDTPVTPVASETLRFEPCALKGEVARPTIAIDNNLQDVEEI